jgi:hypothetical protein
MNRVLRAVPVVAATTLLGVAGLFVSSAQAGGLLLHEYGTAGPGLAAATCWARMTRRWPWY